MTGREKDEFVSSLKEIENYNPSGDPATNQQKRLSIIQNRILIELISTLHDLDKSNRRLTVSNFALQIIVAVLTAITVFSALNKH